VVHTAESEVPESELEDLPEERAPELTEPPDDHNPWDEPEHTAVTAPAKDAELEAPELLNDIPLHVAVELARVQITAEEVVALRAGQVLRLGKGPGEGVELSVNGKVVAHGELVEIEGQLGVRVTSLVG
jgi:flagellar motor switch protein FliM